MDHHCKSHQRSDNSQCCNEIQLGEARETWCAVERMKEEDWCRKQRAHLPRYQEEMKSDIFGFCVISTQFEERCTFEIPKARRREMKHFPKTHTTMVCIPDWGKLLEYGISFSDAAHCVLRPVTGLTDGTAQINLNSSYESMLTMSVWLRDVKDDILLNLYWKLEL